MGAVRQTIQKEKHRRFHGPDQSCIGIPSPKLFLRPELISSDFLIRQCPCKLYNTCFDIRSRIISPIISPSFLWILTRVFGLPLTYYIYSSHTCRVKCYCQDAHIVISLKAPKPHGLQSCSETQEKNCYANAIQGPYFWEELFTHIISIKSCEIEKGKH